MIWSLAKACASQPLQLKLVERRRLGEAIDDLVEVAGAPLRKLSSFAFVASRSRSMPGALACVPVGADYNKICTRL